MIWFLCACFFLILSRYFPDWYGILCLGIFLPILVSLQNFKKILQLNGKVESEILVPLALLGVASFPLGAMPQDFLNLAAASLLLYALSLDKTEILPLYTTSAGIFLLALVSLWLSRGESVVLIFVSLYLIGNRSFLSLSSQSQILLLLAVNLGIGIAALLLSPIGISPLGGFHGFLPFAFGLFTLKHSIQNLFSMRGYTFLVWVISGYTFAFFLGEPFFSPFLYFSFLQTGIHSKLS